MLYVKYTEDVSIVILEYSELDSVPTHTPQDRRYSVKDLPIKSEGLL